MDVEHKIGQMLMVGFQGKTPDEASISPLLRHISEGKVGGVLAFAYNVESPEQIKTLNTALQNAAPDGLPLLIAIDQEGGRVQRLKGPQGFTDYKTPKQVAQDFSPEQAKAYYTGFAQELSTHGFTLNFAPCVDLDGPCPVIGALQRAYHEAPDRLVPYGAAFIQAHRQAGVLTALKHFPGHGLAPGDTHKGFVEITHTFKDQELEPFYQLIQQDLADMVMIAHVTHAGLDPHYPATLSDKYITPLLRERGFQGVCVSDDLHMGALLEFYDLEEIVIRAIRGGIDLLVFSANPAAAGAQGAKTKDLTVETLHRIILGALKAGTIPEHRIHESYDRIVKLKKKPGAGPGLRG